MALMNLKSGRDFLSLMIDRGIVTGNVRRVIIDASIDSALMVYIEEIGDDRMLQLAAMPELKAAITLVDKNKEG